MFSIKVYAKYIIISKRKIRFKQISLLKEYKTQQKGAEQTTETLDNVLRYAQHNFHVMNPPLSQTFREPLYLCYVHGLYISL
jgi:hypothetical protein